MKSLLKSDFTIGFELEGVCDSKEIEDRDILGSKFDEVLGNGNMHRDGSLRLNKNNGGFTFEYSSPVINYTPYNINKVVSFLDSLPKYGVSTNRSCGFHTHISFNNISKDDALWFMFYLCATGKIREFDKLGRTLLYNRSYASNQFIDNIIRNIKDSRISNALNYLVSNEKYRSFRIHPQGTIEWRGPRTFLNTPSHKKTITFFKKLDSLIKCFIESVATNSVDVTQNNITSTYTKSDIIDRINKGSYYCFSFNGKAKKKTFKEACLNNITLLDKLSEKELEKNRDDIATLLTSYSFGLCTFTSKKLFKFILSLIDDTQRNLTKEMVMNILNKFFKKDFINKNINELYSKSLLSTYFITCLKNNDEDVINLLVKCIADNKYRNSVIISLQKSFSSSDATNEYKICMTSYMVKNGLLNICNEDEKVFFVGILKTAKEKLYNTMRYSYNYSPEKLYKTLLIEDVDKLLESIN